MANKKNNMVNNETKLVCPNCGAEFEINKHECQVKSRYRYRCRLWTGNYLHEAQGPPGAAEQGRH